MSTKIKITVFTEVNNQKSKFNFTSTEKARNFIRLFKKSQVVQINAKLDSPECSMYERYIYDKATNKHLKVISNIIEH